MNWRQTRPLFLVMCAACAAPASQRSTTVESQPTPQPAARPLPPADPSAGCPAIQLKAPDSVAAGTPARVSAILAGGPNAPGFNWSLTTGRITSGQHTPELVIDTRGLSGASITATLQLAGLPTQCATTAATTSILVGPPND